MCIQNVSTNPWGVSGEDTCIATGQFPAETAAGRKLVLKSEVVSRVEVDEGAAPRFAIVVYYAGQAQAGR